MPAILVTILNAIIAVEPDAVKLLDEIVKWAEGHPARRVEEVRPLDGHGHAAVAIDELRGTGGAHADGGEASNPATPPEPPHGSSTRGIPLGGYRFEDGTVLLVEVSR